MNVAAIVIDKKVMKPADWVMLQESKYEVATCMSQNKHETALWMC